MTTVLHILGYFCKSHTLLKIVVKNTIRGLLNNLKVIGGMPSNPAALFFFRARMVSLTSFSLIESSRIGT